MSASSFEVVSRREVARAGHLIVEQHRIRNGDEPPFERAVVRHGEVAAVVALTSRREVVLVEVDRFPVGARLEEIPAGGIEPGESPADGAARELEEETGFRPGALEHLCTFYNSPGHCTQRTWVYLATQLERGVRRPLGPEERAMTARSVPLDEAMDRVRNGSITDAKSVTGLLMTADLLSRR